jgi:hypothetical protein
MKKQDKEKTAPAGPRVAKVGNSVSLIFAEMMALMSDVWIRNPRRSQASLLLMFAKLHDKEILQGDSLIRAKLAAKVVQQTGSLDFCSWFVDLAIEVNDKQFFIDFGKCLSGEIKDSTLFDKRERDIAEVVLFNPKMSAKDAVRELQKRGHRRITEENFRMWKMRLLNAKRNFDAVIARLKHNKNSPLAVTDNGN